MIIVKVLPPVQEENEFSSLKKSYGTPIKKEVKKFNISAFSESFGQSPV